MYRSTIQQLHASAVDMASCGTSDSSDPRFLLHEPIAVIASPGRDRLMMGHVETTISHTTCGTRPQATHAPVATHCRPGPRVRCV